MTTEPDNPRDGILMRLRAESHRSQGDAEANEGRLVAQDIAVLITSALSKERPVTPSDVVRAAAVALAATRQTFLSDHHLSARELDEAMPALRHLSAVAEQLASLGDDLASEELVVDMVGAPDRQVPPEIPEESSEWDGEW